MNETPPDNSWASAAAASAELMNAFQSGFATLARYSSVQTIPLMIASKYFNRVEQSRYWSRTPLENFLAYMKLGTMNLDMASRALNGSLQAMDQFIESEISAFLPKILTGTPGAYDQFAHRISHLVKGVSHTYPAAIDAIGKEFGFHFERQPASSKIDETDHFILYQVRPNAPKIKTNPKGKPLLIIPPFVLGANILSFLPDENRSYAHAFANEGIPTYIRVLKDINISESVQRMTQEDDTLDTRRFCQAITKRHGLPVTLNGYCQGGYAALCSLLSGKLDQLVDAFITCVAPMDGTRSTGLSQFLENLPSQFNDLAYGTKQLANGTQVADGDLMGWIYKLKSIETEVPLLAMWRDMMIVARSSNSNGNPSGISKTAAALNYWLMNERNDLPIAITRTSFAAYNTPISSDGTLPIKLFGKPLNLKRLKAQKTPWLICYGLQDDLVEPATALAPLDYIKAEVTPFPKGHVAIATSWSHPQSALALHKVYEDGKSRGPVRFQLDLQKALAKKKRKPVKSIRSARPAKPASVKRKTQAK